MTGLSSVDVVMYKSRCGDVQLLRSRSGAHNAVTRRTAEGMFMQKVTNFVCNMVLMTEQSVLNYYCL